ncbi:MAG: ATP-binding protein [Acidimicrobiia bacterium]
MRLPTRLAVIGVGVLVATLVAVAVITYQLVRVTGRQAVDRVLRDELRTVRTELPLRFPDHAQVTGTELRAAVREYLALHPGSRRHLTVVHIGSDTYSTTTGPDPLVDLRRDGELPEGTPGRLRTVATAEGPTRVLNATLTAAGQEVGQVVVVGTLEDVQADAIASLGSIAAAGSVGLVVGGAVLIVATRRAVRPVTELAAAARATGGRDLTARVPATGRRDEIGTLAHEFNRMLDRIGDDAEHRRRLLSAVSHELRTPLAVARGHAELFGALDVGGRDPGGPGTGDDAAGELVRTMLAELDRLARITDDLEAIAEGRDGGATELGPVFVPDVLDELRGRLTGLGIEGVELRPAPPVVVDADQTRLAQAILNLVANAVTHTPAGTSVVVEATVDGADLCLTVADDGPGIDPAVAKRIFEPFVTTRSTGVTSGSGLGLAVVKSLVEAQGGTVEVRTGPAGTTATIRLALAG